MRGLPPSRVSSVDSSARSSRIRPALSCSSLPRSSAGSRRQCFCASAAFAHARRTSSGELSGTSASSSSVAGFTIRRDEDIDRLLTEEAGRRQ